MNIINVNNILKSIMNQLNMNIVTFSVLSGFILGVLFFISVSLIRLMYCNYIKKKIEKFKNDYLESGINADL